MEIVRWRELAGYLKSGDEIEFVYKGKQYSITTAGGYWNFYCDTDKGPLVRLCVFEERGLLAERAGATEIEGRTLKEIFDGLLYDTASLCIL